jgi:hypothetical protein
LCGQIFRGKKVHLSLGLWQLRIRRSSFGDDRTLFGVYQCGDKRILAIDDIEAINRVPVCAAAESSGDCNT